MDHKEIPTSIPPADERITIVLKAQEGSTLNQIRQFVSLGMPVAIGRGMAVIAGASDEDLQMVLGQEREERQMQAELWEAAIGAPAHLAAHAQEMHALLHRINVKVGGLNAVLGHGGEPSELMWDEHNEALDAIWELLAKIRSAASVDTAQVNQIAQKLENVNQTTGIPVVSEARESLAFGAAPSVITENPAITDLMHIDDRIRMAANARRYEWLRDVAFDTPRQDLVPRDRLGNMLIEQDLDGEIDRAMKAYPGEQDLEESAGRADIGRSGADVQVVQAQQADVDPRDLFIAANPVSVAPGDLEKGCSGFVDHRTHADYLIFLAGYQAAQGVES